MTPNRNQCHETASAEVRKVVPLAAKPSRVEARKAMKLKISY
jgi:hypothetical protein